MDEANSSLLALSNLTLDNIFFCSAALDEAAQLLTLWSQVPFHGLHKTTTATTPHRRCPPHLCDLTTPQRFSDPKVAEAQTSHHDLHRYYPQGPAP